MIAIFVYTKSERYEKIKIIYTFWETSRNRTIYVVSLEDEKKEVHIEVRPNESLEEVLKTNNLI